MNDLPPSMMRFGVELEDAIRRELGTDQRSITRPGRGQRRALARSVGIAAVLAAIAATATLLLGAAASPPPAYALTYNRDGTVTVTVRDLATAIPQLNAKFARLGIEETVVPITALCTTHAPLLISPASSLRQSLTLIAGRKYLLPGWRGVLGAKQLPDGKVGLVFGDVQGRPPACISTNTSRQALGHRHVPSKAGHAASTGSASARSIVRQTLMLAKQNVAAFNKTHR